MNKILGEANASGASTLKRDARSELVNQILANLRRSRVELIAQGGQSHSLAAIDAGDESVTHSVGIGDRKGSGLGRYGSVRVAHGYIISFFLCPVKRFSEISLREPYITQN